jgi:SPP1 gp7 family putative phage head morphogenesis protein
VITLKPILDKHEYSQMIEVVIMDFLTTYFYAPIYSVIEPIEEYYNAANYTPEQIVSAALRSGQIQYINGKFIGQFSAKISKALESLGAKFNNVTKTYNIASTALNINVLEAAAYASMIAMMRQKLLLEALAYINIESAMPELARLLDVPLDTILEDLDEQAYLSLRDAITIVPEITEEQRAALKAQYVDDVSISVKNFTVAQTEKLRAMVEENLFTGLADNKSLVQAIVDEFGVTENKARFLARNETGIFAATFKMITYKEAGITKYRWSTSHDDRVRKFHKDLDGQIITWDNPPIVNDNGDRKHAGFDYQCRCQMIGIIDEPLLPNQ